MEVFAVWIAGALVLVALGVIWRSGATVAVRGALALAMLAAAVPFARRARTRNERGPAVSHDGGYVGSGACRACHPSEYASWSRTYHRTMTQRGKGSIAITTGSHHMQGYWTEDDRGRLHMLPYVYSFDERRTLSRREAFLEPEGEPQHDVRWSSNCIACHATAGRPNLDVDGVEPAVAELGIACEACHGPGGEHVAGERDPITRWRGDAIAITNPMKLSRRSSSAVCGQCHAYSFPRDEGAWYRSGYADTRPGDALEASRILLTPEIIGREVKLDTDARNLFWPDGTVRVGGREYNAMVLSKCWLDGVGARKIGCLSCHSMHGSDPNQQLRTDRSVQDACISCHEMPENHAHHAPGTPGGACVDCHMPKTSYALRRATRSHRIDSPSPSSARPNACNLCHLDKPLAWTARKLGELWGVRADAPADPTPAAAHGLLAADATERVIWADAFGEPGAIAASGSEWEEPVLRAATHDPYGVIRAIATRSLERYPRASRAVLDAAAIDALVSRRDNREVHVAE